MRNEKENFDIQERKKTMYGFKINAKPEELVAYAKKHKDHLGYCGYTFKEIEEKIRADKDRKNGVECPSTGIYSKHSIVAKILNNFFGKTVYCVFHGNDEYIEAEEKEVLLQAANIFHSTVEEIETEHEVSTYKLKEKGKPLCSYFFGICDVFKSKSAFLFATLGETYSARFNESEYEYEKVESVWI